jgi:hypothetical protein
MAQYNKAIVALVMALIGVLNVFFGANITANPEAITAIVSLLTPVLVYLIPNKGN